MAVTPARWSYSPEGRKIADQITHATSLPGVADADPRVGAYNAIVEYGRSTLQSHYSPIVNWLLSLRERFVNTRAALVFTQRLRGYPSFVRERRDTGNVAGVPTTSCRLVPTTDEEVTVLDRENRSAMPLIDGQVCQPRERQRVESAGCVVCDDSSGAFVPQVDLYAIVHDLKNRIAAIRGWAELLQRRADAGLDRVTAIEGLSRIRLSAEEMDERLSEILDLGYSHHHEPGDTDLWMLAERVVDQYRGIAQSHTLTLVGPGSGRVVGNWETRSIERILANLLSNAIKYSPVGGQIRVDIELVGGEARLAVYDQGIGIPGSALPHIFDPFYRAENIHSGPGASQIPGYGIGLSAARNLAHQHAGRIEVASTERQGSIFTLVLPMGHAPSTRRDGTFPVQSADMAKEWNTMQDDNTVDSVPTDVDGGTGTAATSRASAGYSGPVYNMDSDETDIVDLQSMQSFPASDPPTWPAPTPPRQ
jgi:signal transduction histidine kinase